MNESPTLRGARARLDVESYTPWTQNINLFGASPGYQSDLKGYALRARPIFYGLVGVRAADDHPATGFWLSPFGQFGIATATRQGLVRTGHVWAIGLSGGYSWLLVGRMLLLFGIGGQLHVANIPGDSSPPSFQRLYPTLDLNVGYAF